MICNKGTLIAKIICGIELSGDRMSYQEFQAASASDTGKQIDGFAFLSEDEALSLLESGRDGLDEKEAERRFALFGANLLPKGAKRAWYFDLARDFTHFFALMLWFGAALAWFAGLPELSWAIIIVIVVNGVFSFWQEYRAERAAEALQALLPHQVTVRRDGDHKIIPAENVVRGDILVLSEGETIPADARLIKAEKLRLNLSSLTGESKPIPRTTIAHGKHDQPLSVFPNLVFAGTSVSSGRGEAVVFSIGAATEFGRIAQLTQEQTKGLSPLEKELQRVMRFVTVLAVGLGAAFFVLGVMFGGLSLPVAFIFAIGIIVANVPEGLLPTLTLSLAIGVRRMARRRALVKRLSAVETLGATTIILTDKTGTLTENEMTVRELWADGKLTNVETNTKESQASGPTFEVLRTGALCCDAHLVPPPPGSRKWTVIGDPTEAAILVAAAKFGLTEDRLKVFERIAELPFDSVRKRMSTIQSIDGATIACVKGALNEMLRFCTKISWGGEEVELTSDLQEAIQAAHDSLAQKGRRVLAVARRELNSDEPRYDGEWRGSDVERNLTFLGLIAMEDPPRPEVAAAIALCRKAGVRVAMITGDDGLTAAAIGREIGLNGDTPTIITGEQIDRIDDVTLTKLLTQSDVLFARVSPEHKLKLVQTCQKLGEVVAVTGDGVNDAPALRKANIGIAMGATGTDVAREASDMVLTDDNFASIVDAISEGRAVYDNIRKFIGYVFVSNAAEMIPFVVFVMFGVPLPLTIMQVLAVDVGTDLLPALALGAEQPGQEVMERPPRKQSEALLNSGILIRAYLWLGSIEAALALAGYFFAQFLAGWRPGGEFVSSGTVYVTATTVTFAGIVMAQIGSSFAWRSERQSIFSLGFFSNRLLLWCIAAEIGLMLALIYTPPLQRIFQMSPPTLEHWMMIGTFGVVLLLLEELRKLIARRWL
ncbi:MAG: cation-transporting P-type ATPase [Acidobacteria bacterium]|nr:cation-transporting P-type ATPase [Acidobacteriota bacterium]